jgi:hypothetical protein
MPCGVQWPMNHLPKSQKQLHFHLFWDVTKNEWYEYIHIIQINICLKLNCICNYKPVCNHLCDYKSFLLSATEESCIYSCNMVDLDTSCKCMGWNGHDSLHCSYSFRMNVFFIVSQTMSLTLFAWDFFRPMVVNQLPCNTTCIIHKMPTKCP